MTAQLEITPSGPVQGTIRPPGSKSLTNRALVCATLAVGESTLTGALSSDDTRIMIACLRSLGIEIAEDWNSEQLRIQGGGGKIPASTADLFVGNSGTTVRFLTALVSIGQGRYRLDGVDRMRARPIQDLLDALQQLGVQAVSERGTGAPPVIVNAGRLPGGTATVAGDISSQYLSGLLMAAPYSQQGVTLKVAGPLVSQPYVEMTLAVMRAFGVPVESTGEGYVVPSGQYRGRRYAIEPDASAASYFWAAAAITAGDVKVLGLNRSSLQGDVAFCDCLAAMGCNVREERDGIRVIGGPLRGIDVNMNAISDTVQTLAAVALFANGETIIRGVAHNRQKETDRLGDLATELRKFGADVRETEDGLRIRPGSPQEGAVIETYEDHRMAMSLALAGLKIPGVVIDNPQCTSKTYPQYFADLKQLTTAS